MEEKKQKNSSHNPERKMNASVIIKNHMLWSMGAGLIPVPVADFFAVGAIQLDMVRQLCRLYDIDFKEKDGKAVVSALTGAGLSRLGASAAIKFIPGLGSVVGGVTMSVLSGASTYAIGEAFKKHFETGGTFLDLDTNRIRKLYDELFEKGKELARDLQEEQQEKEGGEKPRTHNENQDPSNKDHDEQIIERLKELGKLKADGIITEKEFLAIKSNFLKRNT